MKIYPVILSGGAGRDVFIVVDVQYDFLPGGADAFRCAEEQEIFQAEVERRGISVGAELTGHGIGRRIHEEPDVPNVPEPPSAEPPAETPAAVRAAAGRRP